MDGATIGGATRCMEASMGVPAIHGYSFHPWMEGFYQWHASHASCQQVAANAVEISS